MQGSIGKDYIHLLLSCPPSIAVSKKEDHSDYCRMSCFQNLKRDIRGSTCGQEEETVTEEIIRNYIANQFNEGKNEIFKIEE
ncbi:MULTISPECIES: hypothetical protein [Clostridia]|uniref:hypothetical protein n=1 Tax=Clostridium sp. 1xD42-85 TaxID=2320084 RepID=UPI00256FC356|nr:MULTISPECIES: hypothetical protein [Clostridia]